MRTFPFVLLAAAAVFFSAARAHAGISSILLSLAYLMFTVSFFLVLIAVFCRLKTIARKRDEAAPDSFQPPRVLSPIVKSLRGIWDRMTIFYLEEKTPPKTDAPPLRDTTADYSDGLVEIQKNEDRGHGGETAKRAAPRYGIVYVAAFLFIAVWRIGRMFSIVPLSGAQFRYSIADAVILLVFPCAAAIYLKMRKDEGSRPADKTSRDALALLSYVSLAYAAVIAVSVVFNANITGALQWVFYAAMIYAAAALAGNILLSALANNIIGDFNYRLIPKRAKSGGETSGFLDSQDVRVNFSLKSLYTVKYALKVLPGLFLGLICMLLLSTTIFVVQPHQQAAVHRLGTLDRAGIIGEGLHFKLPWPLARMQLFDVHRINSMRIGQVAFTDADFQLAQFHALDEHLLLLGNGTEKVSVDMQIFYRISDLYRYLKTSSNPQAVLSAAAYEALMNRTVGTTLDAFMSIDRSSLSASILEELAEFSAREGLGLSVVQIIIEGIHPPADVTDVYHMVISASIDKNTIITGAQTEAHRKLISADRQRRAIVNYAHAQRYYRISAAMHEMAVFHAAMEAHQINPGSFEIARYLDVFERVIRGSSVHVFSPGMEDSMSRSVLGRTAAPGALGF